jgi:hypothetical protein
MASKQADLNVELTAPLTTVSFELEAFEVALRSQGVQLVHYRAVPCPVGLTDKDDIRRGHDDHSDCTNGQIYIKAGTITGIFTGNGNKMDQSDMGLLDSANVNVTLPTTYDGSDDEVSVMPFDRFYLAQEVITVPHREYVQSHETGHDRLQHPIVAVLDIVDSNGKQYNSGDYEIKEGQLVWLGAGLPYDAQLKRGMVYSIRYTYRPYWYVSRLLHQIRVVQVQTEAGRVAQRFPQQIALQREYIYEKAKKESTDPDNDRTVKGPAAGGFGER